MKPYKIGIVLGILLLAVAAIFFGVKPVTYVEEKVQEVKIEIDKRDGMQKVTDNIAEMARREVKQGEKVLLIQKDLDRELAVYEKYIASTSDAIGSFNLYYAGI